MLFRQRPKYIQMHRLGGACSSRGRSSFALHSRPAGSTMETRSVVTAVWGISDMEIVFTDDDLARVRVTRLDAMAEMPYASHHWRTPRRSDVADIGVSRADFVHRR